MLPNLLKSLPTVSCAGSLVLTQTHPAAPYVCRTGSITLRCQYDGVESVLAVVWVIGNMQAPDPSNFTGLTAYPPTATYQEVVVNGYNNLVARYRCDGVLMNGTGLPSNYYSPLTECECGVQQCI